MTSQQQAAEEKLRQAEQLAEEKRQRALITRVSIAAITVHYYYSDHPQSGHDDRPHTPLQPTWVQCSSYSLMYLVIIYHSQGLL